MGVNKLVNTLIKNIVADFEMFIHEVGEGLLDGNLVDGSIRVQPSCFSVDLLKGSDPIGCKT
jgi:hypothetical protein